MNDCYGKKFKAFSLCLLLMVLTFGIFPEVNAHESRPLLIEISERENRTVSMRWRIPPTVKPANIPELTLSGCEVISPIGVKQSLAGLMKQGLFSCESLDETKVEINYPQANPSVSTLVRVQRLNGETHSMLNSPEETSISVPAAATTAGVTLEYLGLGVEHILSGYDHLLFVACLILISGTLRRILITITGFTVAHSMTLALAALGIVNIPVPPVEAVIALSIVFLATELTRRHRDTLTWRYPIAVSVSFGLLHGFGFASVLGEIGLPQTEIPAALFAFNVGVEAGQIAFVVVVITLFHSGRWLMQKVQQLEVSTRRATVLLERPTGYFVGSFAAFWAVERISGFWL